MNDDKGMTCEGCGQRVRIYSSGEGTNSYEGVDAEDLGKTHAEVERLLALNASISDDLHDASVEISERDAEIARLKSELDSQRGFVRAVVNPDHALCVKERDERDAEIARLHADYAGVIREKDKIIEKQDAQLNELQIQHSQGLYTPMHEADRKKAHAELSVLRTQLKEQAEQLDALVKAAKKTPMPCLKAHQLPGRKMCREIETWAEGDQELFCHNCKFLEALDSINRGKAS